MPTDQQTAINLCKLVYDNVTDYHYFPALTGGTLYKDGERKDIDIVLYSRRCNGKVICDFEGCIHKLNNIGFSFDFPIIVDSVITPKFSIKSTFLISDDNIVVVDFLFPDNPEISFYDNHDDQIDNDLASICDVVLDENKDLYKRLG